MGRDPKLSATTGPIAYVVIIGGFGALTFISQPFLTSMHHSSRNAECLTNLEFIAATMEEADGPHICGPWPLELPLDRASSWKDAPTCWDALGFERDLRLWGQYEVRPNGKGWLATCRLDLDGDGEIVVYEASDSHRAGIRAGTQD